MGEPPLDVGAENETEDCMFPALAETEVGTPGIVEGVTGADAADEAEFPRSFTAITVNVYAVPFVNPVIVQVNDAVVQAVPETVPPVDAEYAVAV